MIDGWKRVLVLAPHTDDGEFGAGGTIARLVEGGAEVGPGPERDIRDVAPTLLELLGEPVPGEMEGTSLLAPAPAATR